MPASRSTRRATTVTNTRGTRTVVTNVSSDVSARLDALCRAEDTTKSALLRDLIEAHVYLEGHRWGD